ncbi:hypothetical protein PC118_g22295 [Phytophthora cactorum]|uniref:HAT C-terminal dimerisation domain-containing protein n=3 Tax=Phytophthora cactorum TaxID=29920 RepID=A0A8T0Y272_9STRA|nr:hypothetical protein PC111_g16260 [Phytophthora cactorum]KAG2820751.1 hypothetical protein PC113_g22568 [Phytophthora cactorum]KAG2902646.1 hypothetical protein PC114_g12633 [Phytophthora cactorum]KAG2960845.1 hypothetical protein PC118_g22295 [Phytophthora cactorum]KAG3046112.1 hypothetical protein PC121_g20884 [Phytophthora cactorum]
MSSQSLSDFIAGTLSEFERPWSSVLFVVGDNYSVNQYLGDNGGIPFTGCAIRRLNLAVQLYLEEHSVLIDRANKLMWKPATVKGRGCLGKVTVPHPKFKNETRWSSTRKILERCDKLIPCLRQMDTKDAVKCGADKLMLTASEAMVVSELLKDLVKLDSVTVALQSESLTMSEVRDLFDHSISKYPAMKKYLSSNASILNNPVLEQVITGKEESGDEKESQVSFAQQALKRRRLTGPSEVYVDTAFILPTSNICERLFSQSKLIFTDQRRVMKPATLEMLVLLKANCTLW